MRQKKDIWINTQIIDHSNNKRKKTDLTLILNSIRTISSHEKASRQTDEMAVIKS